MNPIPASAARPAGARVQFPFLDLKVQYESIKSEVTDAVISVLESQHYILGREVEALEKDIAAYIGTRFAIGCASGSDALLLAFMAQGIGVGDEVITTPFTFVATAGSIARLGARPVFVDITGEDFNIDATRIEAAITPRTRAIVPVHLFGLSAAMTAIQQVACDRGIAVIEDAAQAIGGTYQDRALGNIGQIGCFSFFPSKNLGGAGDGGILTTNDEEVADRLRVLRVHGSRKKYQYELLGMNSRLDTLQAAVLRVKFQYLEEWVAARRRNAQRYRRIFDGCALRERVTLPTDPDGSRHAYNQFVIRVGKRDRLRAYLAECGIPTEIYYPSPLHLQPAFRYLGYSRGDFPVAERASEEVLALPIYPELTDHQQLAVVEAIAEFYRNE